MAASSKAMARRFGGVAWVWLAAFGLLALFALVPVAMAQSTTDTTVQEGTVETRTIIGIEQGGVTPPQDPVLRALLDNQRRLEQAIFVLEDRIAGVAEMAQQTENRLARGDDPLVALEIEQLWVQIKNLEQENAMLREALTAQTSSQ